jgi:DDE superfamily endonuclease
MRTHPVTLLVLLLEWLAHLKRYEGKIANSQVSVNCHDIEGPLAWPVALRLSLPEQLGLDQNRRDKGKVPKETIFQARPSIALAMPNMANARRGEHSAETADADHSDHPNSLMMSSRVVIRNFRRNFNVRYNLSPGGGGPGPRG